MKEQESVSSFVNFRKLTESVNSKLSVIECTVLKQDNSLETTVLKMVNLLGDWPESPCIFSRKNHPKLIEFIMTNTNNQPTKHFIQTAINHLLQFQTLQTLNQLMVINRSQLPNQFYVSNSSNRVSFWLEEEMVNLLMGYDKIKKLFKPFCWVNSTDDKTVNNEVEYGSETFVNLIEMFSLDCQMKLLSMVDYGGFEMKEIEQAMHGVTSLINYNYRFFFPPKDATRFLKKTAGVTLTCKVQLKQKRSKKWAESVFLDSLFQLRPTKCLARILGHPSGPIYLEKYIFSDYFYAQIQKVYFLGQIEDYFNPKNIRNSGKYLTFGSRVYPESLWTVQAKQQIIKLKANRWLEQKMQLFLGQQKQQSQSDEDSEDDQEITCLKPQPTNQQEKIIISLFNTSQEAITQKIKHELISRINQTRKKQIQMQSLINTYEQQSLQKVIQIDQLANSCRAGNISFCNACGFSNSKISSSENSLVEFISLFNYGNDSFCQSCSDLSIKDRIIAQKIREELQKQEVAQKLQAMRIAQQTGMVEKQVEMIQKKQEKCQNCKCDINVCSKNHEKKAQVIKDQQKTQETKEPKTINNLTQSTQKKQIPSQQQAKTDEQKFLQFIGQIVGQNNIEQDINDEKKKHQIQQTLLEAHEKLRNKAEDQRKINVSSINSQFERRLLLAEKHSLTWYLMILRLKNQCNEFISADYFHDSFQLSLAATQLTSSQYINDELIDVYEYYFNRMLNFIMKTNPGNETQLTSIPSVLANIRSLKQLKYRKVLSNVFDGVLGKCIKLNSKGQKQLSIEIQRDQLTSKLYLFIDQKQQLYEAGIAQHYRVYKQQMNAQYKVTQFQLKDMIAKFQAELKDKIVKTTQDFLFCIRWLVLILTEYVQVKSTRLRVQSTCVQEDGGVAFFINEVEQLLNLLATFLHVFNQPGQTRIVELAQFEITNCIILILENQKCIKQRQKLQFDAQVIQVLIQDMLQHFVSKQSYNSKQDAKKLTSKHQQKFKPTFTSKLANLKIKRLFDSHQQSKQYLHKLTQTTLLTHSKRHIALQKHLLINGELNNTVGYFSSLMFINQYFQKHQRTYYHNFEIWALITLLGSVTVKCFKKEGLVMASKSENQHRVRIGIVYKLILETLQKSQCAPELISVYKSGNKLLLQLTSYLISESYNITLNTTLNQQIALKVKLYIQRTRYRYLKTTPTSTQFHTQTTQILDFLFKNRHLLFDVTNSLSFQLQFHMIIQIVALNALPLFNIQIAYKTQLKEIGKALKHFDVNDGYNAIQDYYLVVLNWRHNKSKEKRKKEIEMKKDKNQGDNWN